MKDKFLTREQLERQSFVHWMRTGKYYIYEDYLQYRTKLERKSASNFIENLMGIDPENFIPEKGKIYVQWEGGECGACSDLDGQIFEFGNEPGELHKNCKCYAILLDTDGFKTEEKIKLKPWQPKKKCTRISSPKGNRKDPFTNKLIEHNGLDFAVPIGTPIPSPVDGVIDRNTYDDTIGNRVSVKDDFGIEHHFYHLQELSYLPNGSKVNKGDVIGYSGNTGSRTTNPHVHYETRNSKKEGSWQEKVIDPDQKDIDYLDKHFTDLHGCLPT